jgi:hypothetical protein
LSVGQYIIKQNISKIKYFTRKKLSETNEHKTTIILDTENKQGLPEWVSELISKGESVSACLSLYKEMQATEREERAAEREMRKTEIEREVRLKELEFREKELSQGATNV